MGTKEIAKT